MKKNENARHYDFETLTSNFEFTRHVCPYNLGNRTFYRIDNCHQAHIERLVISTMLRQMAAQGYRHVEGVGMIKVPQ